MSDSLRDQLLGLGFKPTPKVVQQPKAGKPAASEQRGKQERRPEQQARPAKHAPRNAPGKPGKPKHARTSAEMDLAKAYAIRAQKEKDERIETERLKQEEARKRREAKAKLVELVKDKALNVQDADIARHFPYGGKIKRIYVTQEQLKQLNAAELGVLQLDGRYVLVTAALLLEAEAIFAPAVALKVDPDAPAEDDPYADPQYQVPDDLVW